MPTTEAPGRAGHTARPPARPPLFGAHYRLRMGVSFCAVGDAWFFLDLSNDRYACLVGPAAAAFRNLVNGGPGAVDESALAPLATLLVPAATWSPIVPFRLDALPLTDLSGPVRTFGLVDRCLAIWRLGLAIRAVRRRPLAEVMAGFARRKAQVAAGTVDLAVLCATADAFDSACVALGARDRCLPLSLAVAHSLLRRGVRPRLVFAVKDRPFEAHCWVQVGSLVVNDTLERVRAFTPIYAV